MGEYVATFKSAVSSAYSSFLFYNINDLILNIRDDNSKNCKTKQKFYNSKFGIRIS